MLGPQASHEAEKQDAPTSWLTAETAVAALKPSFVGSPRSGLESLAIYLDRKLISRCSPGGNALKEDLLAPLPLF